MSGLNTQQHDEPAAWLEKALDLAERAFAAYSLSADEYLIGAPMASSLLVRIAAIVLRRGPTNRELETCSEGLEVYAVPLGRYRDGDHERVVFLASRDDFDEPPRASDPATAAAIFRDGQQPPPAVRLTFGRFAAIHLGLCGLLARAASGLTCLAGATVFAPARPHPLAECAVSLFRGAREWNAATPIDWDAITRERAEAERLEWERLRAAEPPEAPWRPGLPKRLLDPPRKRSLVPVWIVLKRRLWALGYPFSTHPVIVRPKSVLVVERATRRVLLRLPLREGVELKTWFQLYGKYPEDVRLCPDERATEALADRISSEMSALFRDLRSDA